MSTDFVQATQEMERDRFGRPMVMPYPGATDKVAYTRCTTFVSACEDTYNLNRWSMRMAAIGFAQRPDYLMAVATTDHSDEAAAKKRLDMLCDNAVEAAKGTAAATIGTALHAMTERLDRNLPVEHVPPDYAPDLAAYVEATAPLKIVHNEVFCVLDTLQIGGTPDRVIEYKGQRYIADVKTGTITYGIGKIAQQLAVYARSAMYDIKTGERTPHGASTQRGLIIHLPAGTGVCNLVWVDLDAGWQGVLLSKAVRAWRKRNYNQLTREGLDAAPFPTSAISEDTGQAPVVIDNLLTAINGATSRTALMDIKRRHEDAFQPHHREAARARWVGLAAQEMTA